LLWNQSGNKKRKRPTYGSYEQKLPLPLGALEVEAKAAKEGIILLRDLGLKEVIVEENALIVMTALSSLNKPPSSI